MWSWLAGDRNSSREELWGLPIIFVLKAFVIKQVGKPAIKMVFETASSLGIL